MQHSSQSADDLEIETIAQFDAQVASGSLAGCYLQSLDLSARSDALLAVDVTRAVFLGCRFGSGVEAAIEARGALVFPTLPDLPFQPYRTGLYRPAELYAGLDRGYRYTLDARTYRWWRHVGTQRSLTSQLAMTLHDHAITEALDDLALAGAVGVMGGHALERGSADYAAAAQLGRSLVAVGHPVLTGGGPGAMEAVNLGAALPPEADLERAVAALAVVPSFGESIEEWARAAFAVTEGQDLPGPSFGVPTWLYGHEPPNVFCVGSAKLFSNAIREDVLLRHASAGLVCLAGAAGTVQEIFQAVTPRYYAHTGPVAPLILVGVEYWTRTVPAWPLLAALATGRPLAGSIHLIDDVAEIPALIG
ncbi:putative lysine decarboxylase [Propionicimonas paludicola]|uniref:Putative lysine decarboxylase n=1 Tax=Propionicimonas paludicola TaxID=185243 RepID=A0A2A9CPY2_9ACTN|nr:LOG family protein [Propionicimonas paludicola]PFG16398.1 putative lysine decarboxylase [Propionicimonas paludicola]